MNNKHSHYYRNVEHLKQIDVYRILDLFKVTEPCRQHALKKIVCAGERGGKDYIQDINEAIDTLKRELEMIDEDNAKDKVGNHG